MLILLIFIFGLFIGSFLNVLTDRLPRGETVMKGRSHCEHCKKTLVWYDLIPLFSFISLRGRCRYCKMRLSWYYPILELVTGITFAGLAYALGSHYALFSMQYTVNLLYSLFIASSFIVLFFTDLKYGILPDVITFPAVFITFLYLIINTQYLIPNTLSAVGALLFFFLLFIGTKGKGMGFGDVKLAFLLGLLLGFPAIILALYIAFISGAVVGVLFLLVKKKKLAGSTIPFGPFLIFGAFVTTIYSQQILNFFHIVVH